LRGGDPSNLIQVMLAKGWVLNPAVARSVSPPACRMKRGGGVSVTVVGAGVAGLTTALALSEGGAEVSVIERGPALGVGACSWLAGGMLAPGCEQESAEPLISDWGMEALAYWPARHAATCQRGTLVVAPARDAPDLDRFARRTTGHQRLDAEAIARLEPDLGGRFRAALFFPLEAHLDPRAALVSLASLLEARGVAIHFDTTFRPGTSSEPIVDCCGLAAIDALPDLRGVKGEMLLLRCPELTLSRPIRLLHPRFPIYIVPRGNGVFMLGATMIESAERGRVSARSVVELLNAAYALHPAFAEAEILELGADARPAFPDNLPRLRQLGRTLYVNGLFRHGFLLSPALAARAADYVLHGTQYPEVMDEDPRQQRSA
jgi:glycine oxidase